MLTKASTVKTSEASKAGFFNLEPASRTSMVPSHTTVPRSA